jgi:hypothetical protein
MDRQMFVDKILEAENLTDNLEDDAANSLLNWGMAHVDDLIKDVADDDVAGEKINSLMHVMRGLNSLAGNPAKISHEALADLLDRYVAAMGGALQAEEQERREVADRVSKMQPGEAVRFLTEWLRTKKS